MAIGGQEKAMDGGPSPLSGTGTRPKLRRVRLA